MSNVLTQLAVLGTVLVVAQADVVWAVRLIMLSVTVLLCLIPISASYRLRFSAPASRAGSRRGSGGSRSQPARRAVSTLVVPRTEVLALTWLSDPVSVGLFALAFGLAGHMYAPAQAIIGPLVPAISGLREVDAPSVAKAFGRALRGSSTVVTLLSGIALPAVAVLTPTLYGSSYTGVEPVVLAIGVANGFLVVGAPVSAFVMARLSASRVLVASLVALLVDVVLALGLIPVWGVWGAVVANIGATTTQMLILLVSELTALHLSWATVGRDIVPVFVGAVVALLAWYASTFVPSVWWAAAVAAVVGVVGVVGLLWAGRSGLTAATWGLWSACCRCGRAVRSARSSGASGGATRRPCDTVQHPLDRSRGVGPAEPFGVDPAARGPAVTVDVHRLQRVPQRLVVVGVEVGGSVAGHLR